MDRSPVSLRHANLSNNPKKGAADPKARQLAPKPHHISFEPPGTAIATWFAEKSYRFFSYLYFSKRNLESAEPAEICSTRDANRCQEKVHPSRGMQGGSSIITCNRLARSTTIGKVAAVEAEVEPPKDVKLKEPTGKLNGSHIYGIDLKLSAVGTLSALGVRP